MPKPLLGFFTTMLRPYSRYILAVVFSAVIYGFTQTIMPYLIKMVIDSLNDGSSNLVVYLYALAYMLALGVQAANFRFSDWIHIRLLPALRYDITTKMYAYLSHHSYRLFQTNFGGSLTNKISDMNNGVINIFRINDEALGV